MLETWVWCDIHIWSQRRSTAGDSLGLLSRRSQASDSERLWEKIITKMVLKLWWDATWYLSWVCKQIIVHCADFQYKSPLIRCLAFKKSEEVQGIGANAQNRETDEGGSGPRNIDRAPSW